MEFGWIFELLSVDPNKYDLKWRLEAQHVEPVNIFFYDSNNFVHKNWMLLYNG